MGARFRSWWQKIRQRRVAIIVTTTIIVVAIVLIIVGYWLDWAGFNRYTQVSTIHTLSGPTAGTVTRTEAYQPGKTLWDWLQLLIIPAVLTLGAIWYTARQNHDLQITLDNQRETMLQTYFDKMSDLLLHENLRTAKRGDDVTNIAHARTLTALPKLDPNRKRSIILFLVESELINRSDWIIDTSFADLREVDLSQNLKLDSVSLEGAYLQGANLSGADLSRANLESTNLYHANLSGTVLWEASLKEANLAGADLTGANLTRANLKGVTGITVESLKKQVKLLTGATMPDGSIHP